uniref:Uncharacterized protein n=1 Tax=Moniliophthora roreri TaxID=221103 RepID=A0A0W0FF06_MONRR
MVPWKIQNRLLLKPVENLTMAQ